MLNAGFIVNIHMELILTIETLLRFIRLTFFIIRYDGVEKLANSFEMDKI